MRVSLLAAVVLLLSATPASAATFDVTTTADGAGQCPTIRNVPCTLRQAITNANGNGAGTFDTINLPAGMYTLTSALPAVTDAIILGANAATTTVQGNGTFRIFSVQSEAIVGIGSLTIANGAATGASDDVGGNIRVGAGSTLLLDHSRVMGGKAGRGGGIGIQGGAATITSSLIDHNQAVNVVGTNLSGDGGGILNTNQGGNGAAIKISDSTIAFNKAQTGAGIVVRDSGGNATTLTRSTVAFNDASSFAGGGIYLPDAQTFTATGSIVSNNTGNLSQAAVLIGPSNCGGATKPTSGGFNVESLADCNFTAGTDRRNTDPLLPKALADGGQTPVLPIPTNSPAVNLMPAGNAACTGSDQRDLARPQGAGCDAGAYEADVTPPAETIDSGPEGTITGSSASFTFSSPESGITFACRLDGPAGQGTFGACTSPASFSGLAPGAYTFVVRATDASGNQTTTTRSFTVAVVQPAPSPTPTPTPTAPVPVFHQSVVIQPVRGKTLVKLPGASKYTPVDVTIGIPLGSIVDTRKSEIRLFSIPKPGKPAESALFFDGIFKVTQVGGITQLQLVQALRCTKPGKASVAAKKPKTRKLWGDGTGSFRTRGHYSAATVRGTKWLVQDTCTTTLTRVAKGVVSVQDFVKHKTLLVRAPHRYTARKKR